MNPPLIDMVNFCNERGYDILVVDEGKKYKCIVTKEDDFLKTGKKHFDNWMDAQKEGFTKLYNALIK